MELKIKRVNRLEWPRAAASADRFLLDYPHKRGIRDGCVYADDDGYKVYVYRTVTMVVVVGLE